MNRPSSLAAPPCLRIEEARMAASFTKRRVQLRDPGMNVAERTATLLDCLRSLDDSGPAGEPGCVSARSKEQPAVQQNPQALGELFTLYRERLWRMLYVRL